MPQAPCWPAAVTVSSCPQASMPVGYQQVEHVGAESGYGGQDGQVPAGAVPVGSQAADAGCAAGPASANPDIVQRPDEDAADDGVAVAQGGRQPEAVPAAAVPASQDRRRGNRRSEL